MLSKICQKVRTYDTVCVELLVTMVTMSIAAVVAFAASVHL
jgi:hypothetical protein